ncbi:hypothetical protein [Bacillus sp. HMF5848]|uniref:hypothetical protein n=1 Tax=Bacillus sp. HMF5848 TaxID=2495421 RepID=UPI00163985F3|nr:hypothetical protein [Bacillus sp. HMF5848]
MEVRVERINPNQTLVAYWDGRYEVLTDEELDDLMMNIQPQDTADDQMMFPIN